MREQNTYLKTEVTQLKSSKKQLSSELGRLKDKYQKSTFINEAERIMEQLNGILIETKSNFTKFPFLTKHKVRYSLHFLAYCMYIVVVNVAL